MLITCLSSLYEDCFHTLSPGKLQYIQISQWLASLLAPPTSECTMLTVPLIIICTSVEVTKTKVKWRRDKEMLKQSVTLSCLLLQTPSNYGQGLEPLIAWKIEYGHIIPTSQNVIEVFLFLLPNCCSIPFYYLQKVSEDLFTYKVWLL